MKDDTRVVCRDGTNIPLEQAYRENRDFNHEPPTPIERIPLSEKYKSKEDGWAVVHSEK